LFWKIVLFLIILQITKLFKIINYATEKREREKERYLKLIALHSTVYY